MRNILVYISAIGNNFALNKIATIIEPVSIKKVENQNMYIVKPTIRSGYHKKIYGSKPNTRIKKCV